MNEVEFFVLTIDEFSDVVDMDAYVSREAAVSAMERRDDPPQNHIYAIEARQERWPQQTLYRREGLSRGAPNEDQLQWTRRDVTFHEA